MERLTPEQIRLLEELRELRDNGILTVDDFELQVAKVLGRPLVVEPLPGDEELLAPDDTPAAELLKYEFVEPATSDEGGIQEEENQVVETQTITDSPALSIAETDPQQNKLSRRKLLIGITASLIFIIVIALVALGGGKSDSTSSQINDSTTIVTQSTSTVTTQAATTSTTTTTEVIPTYTYEVLQCPYTRVIEAVDGKIVTPEGITLGLRPATYKIRRYETPGLLTFREESGSQAGVQVTNPTDLRLRIGMELEWSWPSGSLKVQWAPDNGRGNLNGFATGTIRVEDENTVSQEPITDIQLKIVNATIKYLCP